MNSKTGGKERDRATAYPGIAIRFGPAGHRAGLAEGPDVWEVCWLVGQLGNGEGAIQSLVEHFSLTPDQVETALRYAAEFPEEIEARIELHESETVRYESLVSD